MYHDELALTLLMQWRILRENPMAPGGFYVLAILAKSCK